MAETNNLTKLISVEDDVDVNFNTYVGAETGVLKGVCFGTDTPILKNFMSYGDLDKPTAIRSLSWADETTQKELLVAFTNRTVKVYNTKVRAFTQGIQLNVDDSPLMDVNIYESNYVVGLESGKVSMWNFHEASSVLDIQTGTHLSKVRHCPADRSIIATGGKENDLKIWNLKSERPEEPIFKARNVPHVLELRTPIWVQDLTFLPRTTDMVAVASRHGFLRLYDTKMDNRNRPVIDMPFCDHPIMSISATRNDRQVIVGSSQGKVGLVDLRNYGKEKLVHLFHGFNGSVRSISADEDTPFFVSSGLDRHLYLHNINEKKPIKKLYLKSRLTCTVITKDFLKEQPEEVKSIWHNIDMDLLPGATSDIIDSPKPAKRPKKIRD